MNWVLRMEPDCMTNNWYHQISWQWTNGGNEPPFDMVDVIYHYWWLIQLNHCSPNLVDVFHRCFHSLLCLHLCNPSTPQINLFRCHLRAICTWAIHSKNGCMLPLSKSACHTALYEALVSSFLPSPWSGDKLNAFHQKRGVALVLLMLREVEEDGNIAEECCCWPTHAPEVSKECVLQAFYVIECAQVQTGLKIQ